MRILTWLLLLAGPAAAGEPGDVIDAFAYPDAAAARAAWKPMAGSAPVSVVDKDGRRALRLPCTFRGTRFERASWDLSVSLDLASARGVRFDCFCPDLAPISGFSFYLQSGGGWYAATFSPAAKAGWNTIAIDKEDTGIEGTPAGWGRIQTIRISAWRGADADTEFFISDFRVVGRDARVAVIRGDSVAKSSPGETDSVRLYTQSVTQCLKDLGLAYVVLSDLDANAGALQGRRLAILPHNPSIPDAAAGAVAGFLQGGGRLISFYSLPPAIAAAAGVEPGAHVRETFRGYFASMRFSDPLPAGMPAVVPQRSWNIRDAKPAAGRGRVAAVWHSQDGAPTGHAAVVQTDAGFHVTHVLVPEDLESKRRMLLAMAGHFVPELWREAARAVADRVGRLGPYAAFDEARRGIAEAAAGDAGVLAALGAAAQRRAEARDLAAAGKFPESMAKSDEARRMLLDAYGRAQKPEPNEHRAFWCHTAYGAAGLAWDEAVKRLAENGFTALLPNMLWGGVADYESAVLPVAADVRQKGDPLAACLAACRKHGLQCHVWKVNWNLGGRAPKEFVERMKREGRLQVRFDGAPLDWLCPSHPENRKLELDAMLEVATKYDVDGIHFDYIRYPDRDGCFCAGCRERFERAAGAPVAKWPADVRADRALEATWNDFRREQITALVAAVSAAARKARPKIRISAAVFANWPVDRDGVGQDWKLWCERGYLDFVCPMDYTPYDAAFEGLVEKQIAWAGKVPCYPGIGLSCWTPPDDVVGLIDKIRIARRLKTGGFTVFDYSTPATQGVLSICGLGITRRR